MIDSTKACNPHVYPTCTPLNAGCRNNHFFNIRLISIRKTHTPKRTGIVYLYTRATVSGKWYVVNRPKRVFGCSFLLGLAWALYSTLSLHRYVCFLMIFKSRALFWVVVGTQSSFYSPFSFICLWCTDMKSVM